MFDFQLIQTYLDRIEPYLALTENIGGKIAVCLVLLAALTVLMGVAVVLLNVIKAGCYTLLAAFGCEPAKKALVRQRIKIATVFADQRDAAREQIEWALKWNVVDTSFEQKLLKRLAAALKPKTAALPAPRN